MLRVPAALDTFFRALRPRVHWHHVDSCRLLVLTMAVLWSRRHGANGCRSLEAPHHRTRCNNFLLGARWAPAASLRPKARELRRAPPNG